MEERYHPTAIEQKWQHHWDKNQTFKVDESPEKEKYYVLEMFPYPSGRIHMGHVRNYAIGDVVARFKRMQGYNVLHPMGWDAFGMPAENAAIQHGVHPAKWTWENIDSMRKQLKKIGFSYDWDREFATCSPEYYRWEQKVFLKMFEQGLAYKKSSAVNWCHDCHTVLANEQVDDGQCWRCGKEVEQKELEQWFFKTTAYADELLDGMKQLDGWPDQVLTMQRNWIGKSHGCEIDFSVAEKDLSVRVFTTRPDTLFGATFMSLATEHPLVPQLIQEEQRKEVEAFIEKVRKQDTTERSAETMEKEGVFTGSYCVNPVTGDRMPIYLANFVLMGYGTGAVMAVPAHDQRDFDFAQKYNLPIQPVILPEGGSDEPLDEAWTGNGTLIHSGDFSGMATDDAKKAIAEHLQSKGQGKATINYRLRDWGVSRQRYWGTPIPVIYCDACGVVPVPEKDLPVVLPEDVTLSAEGGTPLSRHEDFLSVDCPTCGTKARRETDTFDTFVESSWYFARYACPDLTDDVLDKAAADYWLPVDQYIGGIEHAVMHLLYARFWTKVLRDLGYLSVDEPFANLLTQGMVCMETQTCPEHGWLYPEEVEHGTCTRCGQSVLGGRIEKMSKSKKNVVDPDELIQAFGADTARLFALFAAPPEKDLEWNEQGVEGCSRFLNRVWRLVYDNLDVVQKSDVPVEQEPLAKELRRQVHQTIKKVTTDMDGRFHFNTAIAAVMELLNTISGFKQAKDYPGVLREALETVVKLLSPFVPHLSEELWATLGHDGGIHGVGWPVVDESALVKEDQMIVVQVCGKVRAKITVAVDVDEASVKEAALADPNVERFIDGKTIRKVIYVPGRLLNIVAN